jgi:hypothetical protein
MRTTGPQAVQAVTQTLAANAAVDANIAAARDDLVALVGRFADGHSPGPAIDALLGLGGRVACPVAKAGAKLAAAAEPGADAITTPAASKKEAEELELADLLADWATWYTRCATDAAYVASDEYLRRGRSLVERTTQRPAAAGLRNALGVAVEEWRAFITAWTHDPLTTQLVKAATGLAAALPGVVADPAARTDVRDVIVPAVISAAHAVPLPHIEAGSTQAGIRVALDDVVLPASLMMPRAVELRTSGVLRRRDVIIGRQAAPQWHAGLHVRATGMVGALNGIRFVVARRMWPAFRDRGFVDVRISGRRGLSFSADIDTCRAAEMPIPTLVPRRVVVSCYKVKLRFRGVKHSTYFRVIRPLVQSRVRRSLEEAVCDRVVTAIGLTNTLGRILSRALPSV